MVCKKQLVDAQERIADSLEAETMIGVVRRSSPALRWWRERDLTAQDKLCGEKHVIGARVFVT